MGAPTRYSEDDVTEASAHLLTAFLLLALAGCSGDDVSGDAGMDTGPVMDTGADIDTGADSGADTGPAVRTREEVPLPGMLMAGLAEVRIPAPVGIGTTGYNALDEDPSVTPFADTFPGTTHVHGQINLRAVALSRGDAHEVVIVRMDTIGVFAQMRTAVLRELMERTGHDYSDSLLLAANHTHSGPGRLLLTTGALTLIGDSFLPEYYDDFISALADVVELAMADLAPAEVGTVMAATSEAHDDRRCENDALPLLQESGDMPLVGVRREGRLDALIASYGYHGTVLSMSDLTLSGDVGSVIEQKIEERMDHPVLVLFLNSWGADMSPSNPPVDPMAVGADQPGGFERMQRVGDVVADAIMPRLADITYGADVPVRVRTYRVPIDRTWIGYGQYEFPYRNGAAFCGLEEDGNCVDEAPVLNLDQRCVPLAESDGLPKQTLISAGEIGGLSFVTAPGEWSTSLANSVLDRVRERTGADAMFIGYTNDYTGYALHRDDWFQGGYEASGALWGPLQGDYLAGRMFECFETFADTWNETPWWEPAEVEPFSGYTYDPYVPETPVGLGTLGVDVPSTVSTTDVVTFTVEGSDPWLGNPVATLERENMDGTFSPVVRGNGRTVDSNSYDFWLDLTTDPTYEESIRSDRTFHWQISFPVSVRAASSIPPLAGNHRFSVRVPATTGEMTVTTGVFSVE